MKFGKRELTDERIEKIRAPRKSDETVPAIIERQGSVRRASIERLMDSTIHVWRQAADLQAKAETGRGGRRLRE